MSKIYFAFQNIQTKTDGFSGTLKKPETNPNIDVTNAGRLIEVRTSILGNITQGSMVIGQVIQQVVREKDCCTSSHPAHQVCNKFSDCHTL